MEYRFATIDDLDLLVQLRLDFIEVDINQNEYTAIKDNCYSYFQDAFMKGLCDVIFAEEENCVIGTAIIFYYNSVPSTFNVTGRNAYITSMYVQEEHRRKGIASSMLHRLIENAKHKGYSIIMLNASEMGKSLYKKFGFTDIHSGMLLKISL